MASSLDLELSLDRGVRRLVDLADTHHASHDGDDGTDRVLRHFEGEDVWNSMLPAQYAMAMHVMGEELSEERKRRIVRQLEHEQLPGGLWGLHRFGEPSLFMTALSYVAARCVGVPADDPRLAAARTMFASEDVRAIPSWGKAWLSLMNVYGWEGVNAVPPEAWLLPERLPLHPANYYCHTRLIYMGMASVFGQKLRAPRSALVDALRAELYPNRDYASIDFRSARHLLREDDLWAPPTKTLKAMYEAVNLFERVQSKIPGLGLRARCLAELRERMKFELRSSDHTCLSPVNGLLFMLTLWAHDPKDPDLAEQRRRFEGWIWEDEDEGLRICGARSATWDTSFAIQSLVASRPSVSPSTRTRLDAVVEESVAWLRSQQITAPQRPLDEYKRAYRVDPTGGFCFAGIWHGWPVSDCTAEALEAFLEADAITPHDPQVLTAGIRFLLQCQNPDGGFGSYEARKSMEMEWMNPAEMFGDSMTERSYVECTASNLIALVRVRARLQQTGGEGQLLRRMDQAIRQAERLLRKRQNEDGSWDGAWGVAFLYGTLFGIRGLRAAGADASDPAIAAATEFIRGHQRADGAWGEHWRTCLTDRYEPFDHGHIVQTAWAVLALANASEAPSPEDEAAILRGCAWLASQQQADGDWPEQEFSGVFFRTALIDYRAYRRVFPVWALSYGAALHKRLGAHRPAAQPVA